MTTTVRSRKDGSRILESEKQIITTEADTACPICQDPVGKQTPEGTVEGWSELPCGHQFGSVCIKQYLGIVAEDGPSCPICRQPAHHSRCGHPVLPSVLNPHDMSNDSVLKTKTFTTKTRMNRVENLGGTYCGYCEGIRGTRNWSRVAAAGRPHRRWTAPFRWLRIFDFRSSRNTPRTILVTRAGDVHIEGQNPWEVTAYWKYPRGSRDPGWESWWANQLPKSA
ncbi:hypothetical protein QBC35DRAFT_375797 [Podospora australis]|uniref:RING-type domain-containing protein n=1 Tax=Podospora australis TaxID=1536484 RepID=A0AAN6X134_9PEZI|nr:hypothetical protein QBC35DRAFT_375797 [Podospora australis]